MSAPPAGPPPAGPPPAGPRLWRDLRHFTAARVALGRVGAAGLPTPAHLAFQAAHAAARDAVHAALDGPALAADLAARGIASVTVRSLAPDRRSYLLRPDLGRMLDPACLPALDAVRAPGSVAFLLADGLSALAVARHAPALTAALIAGLGRAGIAAGPVVLAHQGRVALGDKVGAALGAAAIVVLIGERPGLSTADSLGAYLTWAPQPGRNDAERNCVSNIRPEGLDLPDAAAKLLWLIAAMCERRISGVGLKDEQPMAARLAAGGHPEKPASRAADAFPRIGDSR
ncbi:MAG: ethanolamine ammonia-lyase subunit EutC [Rhodospirillales bacterium]|nr:ethanolamine ammonia-lyase subunit EutC [Rhodospirillales bacterium]